LLPFLIHECKTGALHTLLGENTDYHVKKSVDLLRELVNEYKKVQTEEEDMTTLSGPPRCLIGIEEVSSTSETLLPL
jgi:hypothetical protein